MPVSPQKFDYLPADVFCVFNDGDRDITPVTLRLPDPPPIEEIDGYGIQPELQKFKRIETPPRLKALEKKALQMLKEEHTTNSREKPSGYKYQKIFWKLLSDNYDSYREEIKFIGKIQWFLTYGYWFFNCGKPTWLPPWFFSYLMFWSFPKGEKPEYHDMERRMAIWKWYNYTCTETFENVDMNGNALPDEDGNYKMKDIGVRTSFGVQNPKRRQRGDTNSGLNDIKCIAYRNRRVETTIVSDTGEHAEDAFKTKLIPALREEPVWIKPIWEGSFDTNRILLRPPSGFYTEDCLDSAITFTESSTERANDSKQLFGIIEDEKGKGAVRSDTANRWEINIKTLHLGPRIHGWSEHPSTVEEMENAAEYQTMWKESDFYVRDPMTGWTKSGVTRIYFHSWDYMMGFVDPWGYSVIDDPTPLQLQYASKNSDYAHLKVGAKRYIEEPLLRLASSPDSQDQKKYRLRVKKTPLKSSDMWMSAINDLGFDYILLNKRKIELIREPKSKKITLSWENNERDTKVVWREDPNGRFVVSDIERWAKQANQVTMTPVPIWNEKSQKFEHQKAPALLTVTTASADPYEMSGVNPNKRQKKTKLSDGGGAVMENHDPSIDKDVDPRNWKTKNLICYYQQRLLSVYDYFEDMIMMCVFFNAPLAFERQKNLIQSYFLDRKYGGYFKYEQKPDGTFDPKPGFYAGEKNKNELFVESVNYINTRGHACNIPDYINDCLEIKGYDDMTNRDGFTAVGWALKASSGTQNYGKSQETFKQVEFSWEKFYQEAPFRY
jgi:hypothetical protein